MRISSLIISILLISLTTGFSQFVLVPLPKSPPKKGGKIRDAKIKALTPLLLPFWDDFSFSNSKNYPHDTLWQYGQSVTLNYGEGINPPSLGVVTFDGLDSLGKPYNINDPLAKGYADKLISRPIRLDTVPLNLRTTVYLSFYYESAGNGESPDPGDHLQVDFKNKLGQWETIANIANDGTMKSDTFKTMVLQVDSSKFFHRDFQFRFRSYGRLSGPYDNWNLDYVYLNSGRTPTDTSFPDRAIATPMASLFNEYWSIPKKHFITGILSNLKRPSLDLYNLSSTIDQPLNYSYDVEVITYLGNTTNSSGPVQLDDSTSLGDILPLTRKKTTVDTTPPVGLFDPAADSFRIKLKFGLRTKDNVLIPPGDNGDYDAAIYKPINFRLNDTTRAEYILSSYYAYDDGTAEYGIGLNQPGARAAYRFDMKTADPDTIVAVDIYFPRFGDETNQIIELSILNDLKDTEQSILYKSNITVNRSELDTLRRYQLNVNTIGVQGSFYIGWKQSSAVSIPMGWDKNTDSGDNIYFNLNGLWEQNTTERGSIMIHPVFGRGGLVTGLHEAAQTIHAFPNPNAGIFYLNGEPEYLEMVDLAGKPVDFSKEKYDLQTKIEMANAHPGIYVLKIYLNGKYTTHKILVRP